MGTGDPKAVFREGQLESIVQLVESKKRLFVVQRTGWGKSIVYFIATALLRERGAGPTLLISPLLALMRNQLLHAERLGIRPATINSSNRDDWRAIEARIRGGTIDLLLVSPERLANDEFVTNVLGPIAHSVGMFVVDEAHCISDWGHDFRPDYRRITRILRFLPPGIPLLATTATANDRVVEDVATQLGSGLTLLRGPLRRDSLRLQNIRLGTQAERLAWLAEQVPSVPGTGIIYTLTVRDAQQVARWLKHRGLDAEAYWGDLDNEARLDLERRLLNNELKAVVATSALGMGFDKRDLGFVIHYQRPGSVIHYYQQVGRAGRAIDEALGILLSGDEDDDIADYFINTAFAAEDDIRSVLGALESSEAGLTLDEIGARINVRRNAVEKVLKNLSVDSPAPVVYEKPRWRRTPNPYVHDGQRIGRITTLRRSEQTRMSEYVMSDGCLMAFLSGELDDVDTVPCGRCAVCAGRPLLPVTISADRVAAASAWLKGRHELITPRRRWPGHALARFGWTSNIRPELQMAEGRVLSVWGDSGWGDLVRSGKQLAHLFDEQLVMATVDLIRRWQPAPAPAWITFVPSRRVSDLVRNFAERVGEALDLPVVDCISVRPGTPPQKMMLNSAQQALNAAETFMVRPDLVRNAPVLILDDIVDSGWTLTVIAARLREAGAGVVIPFALSYAGGQ